MIVECPACQTIFPVDPKKVPTAGIHARCSVCSEVFFVSVPEPDEGTSPEDEAFGEVEAVETAAEPEVATAEGEEEVLEAGVVETEETAFIEAEAADQETVVYEASEDAALEEVPSAAEVVVEAEEVVVGEEAHPAFDEPSTVVEEPAPVFEGAEATFARAEEVVDEVAVEASGEVEEVASAAVEEVESAAEEMAAGFEEPTFGTMDDVGVVSATPSETGPIFGKRDPKEKAQRLARVLVSDIILYNPDRHHSATETGRVKEEFEEEIQKSWNEYVEQVGEEIANSTSYFNDALNEILAKGEQIF
jgi:predicted Zn finger-like uncharacterized protein